MAPRSAAPVAVRAAQISDSARIAELSGQLGYPSTYDQVETRLREIQATAEHAVFVAQLATGEVAGALDVFVMRTMEAEPRAEIGGLIVDERYRSQGLGQRLMERADEWAREKHCAEVGLRSNVIRDRAHAFYERLGYRVVKTQKAFRKML
ncbi:MAG: GNAT family N-acetyltransferase [Candidatus Acidiferrales bacterium]